MRTFDGRQLTWRDDWSVALASVVLANLIAAAFGIDPTAPWIGPLEFIGLCILVGVPLQAAVALIRRRRRDVTNSRPN